MSLSIPATERRHSRPFHVDRGIKNPAGLRQSLRGEQRSVTNSPKTISFWLGSLTGPMYEIGQYTSCNMLELLSRDDGIRSAQSAKSAGTAIERSVTFCDERGLYCDGGFPSYDVCGENTVETRLCRLGTAESGDRHWRQLVIFYSTDHFVDNYGQIRLGLLQDFLSCWRRFLWWVI